MNESNILASESSFVRPGDASLGGMRWQQVFREAIRDPRELCRLLELPPGLETAAVRAADAFPLFAPRGYVAQMRIGDPGDPLLRQVLPLDEELAERSDFAADPVGDAAAILDAGLLQKYHGRALMVTTG